MAKKSPSNVTAAAKTLGAKGGKKGGPARAKVLAAGRRSDIAKMGAEARKKKYPRKKSSA